MKFASLFAGIGGFEAGLRATEHVPVLMSEILPSACAVLRARFDDVDIVGDVREIRTLPEGLDLICAGFPCQDLSQAGRTLGIEGDRSSLVSEVFRIAKTARPEWLLLENVPFMLQLQRGKAMRHIADELESLGYKWAWRVVDTYSFGLPQRRERVFIVASRNGDPEDVLLADDHPIPRPESDVGTKAHGFYWTEGRTGLGWAADAVPTLKNGSAVGIPSPPAILLPDGNIIKPDIRDAERLQGFQADWTSPAAEVGRASARWALVGSAVSTPVSQWLGTRLRDPGTYDRARDRTFDTSRTLPRAARFDGFRRFSVNITTDPIGTPSPHLAEFLSRPGTPLSARATGSFLARTRVAKLRFQPGFIEAVEAYLKRIEADFKIAA